MFLDCCSSTILSILFQMKCKCGLNIEKSQMDVHQVVTKPRTKSWARVPLSFFILLFYMHFRKFPLWPIVPLLFPRAQSAVRGWSLASTVTWRSCSASLNSTRTIAGHALNHVPSASPTWCWGSRPSTRPCVVVLLPPRKGTTAGQVTARQSTRPLEPGSKPTPSGTCWRPKREALRITTWLRGSAVFHHAP